MKFCFSVVFAFLPIFSFAVLQDVSLLDDIENLSFMSVLENCETADGMVDTTSDTVLIMEYSRFWY